MMSPRPSIVKPFAGPHAWSLGKTILTGASRPFATSTMTVVPNTHQQSYTNRPARSVNAVGNESSARSAMAEWANVNDRTLLAHQTLPRE